MRGQNFLPATASPADSERSILIFRGKLELINISVWLFCSTGIISHQPNASLSRSFAPQGLFPPVGCISIGLFCSTGITLPRSDASLSGSFVPQGLFCPAECISIGLFCAAGIISTGRMHLCLALLFHRDYFDRSDTSLLAASSAIISFHRKLKVYPPIVAAIFAVTGSMDHQPSQVSISVTSCSAQMMPHAHLLFKKCFSLLRQNDRTVFNI